MGKNIEVISIPKRSIFAYTDLVIELTRCIENQRFSQQLLELHREKLINCIVGNHTDDNDLKQTATCIIGIFINLLPGKTLAELGIVLF